MNITLSSELVRLIHQQIESGQYASPDEVILAGIKLLAERQAIYKDRFEELQQEIGEGLEASERGEIVDGETMFQALHEKLQQQRTQAGQ
ncbi:MAG: type II toxin-antitoxin system ParD family antitoxin [Phormidesmis sp. CAN_BIN36]|nr:type II toxin-antitoxin system ParD family antitoxin [Phormidesmis sp. CAN_BIN36]